MTNVQVLVKPVNILAAERFDDVTTKGFFKLWDGETIDPYQSQNTSTIKE